jgi:hypothetical protein
MKKIKATLVCLSVVFGTQITKAQDTKKWVGYGELSLSAGNAISGSFNWSHLYGFGSRNQFRVGYGVRYSTVFGSDLDYITAPAKLTSEEANLDTFQVASPMFHAINLGIYLQYDITPKFHVGFNIDAIGLSFGPSKTGKFTSDRLPGKPSTNLEAKPTGLNVLLVGDNDIGTLNSELFVRYQFNEHWGVKGGLTYVFTEYTTTTKPVLDNDRFRNKAMLGMLGFSYQF